MKVLEARVAHPINARGGLYVEIEGTQEEIYKGAADRLAVRTANRQGWEEAAKPRSACLFVKASICTRAHTGFMKSRNLLFDKRKEKDKT